MPEKILLRCLLKNSNPYRVVKELKSSKKEFGKKELDFDELKSKLGMEKRVLIQTITGLYPSVTQTDSKVSITENYNFLVIDNIGNTAYYHIRCAKYNRPKRTSKKVPVEARDLEIIQAKS